VDLLVCLHQFHVIYNTPGRDCVGEERSASSKKLMERMKLKRSVDVRALRCQRREIVTEALGNQVNGLH
jgi:hypothetical protein